MSGDLLMVEAPATSRVTARSEWWALDRLALACSGLSALSLYALVGRGGWYVDDFLNFDLAKNNPLGRRYLELPIFGHPQPAVRLVNWLLYRISPMNYPLATAFVCLGVGGMTWLVYRILRMAFRPSPWHLVLTAMVSVTGLWVPVTAWWAGSAEIAACVVAGMFMTHAMLRCYRGRHRIWWGMLAGLWLLFGLAWYERALFGAAFAAWFLPAVSCRSARPSQLLAVLRRAWPGYLALLAVALAYLRYYTTHHFVSAVAGYSTAELLHFLWVCWSHAMIPGLFGGSLTTGHLDVLSYAHPPLWWLTTCQLALLVLVGYGLRRNRWRAALAWLAFLAIFLPAQYTIATARLYVHHARIGQEFRYVADLLPLLVLTIGISILQPSGLLPGGEPSTLTAAATSRGAPPVRANRRHLLLTGAVLAALIAVYLATALPVADRWVNSRHVSYLRNLRASVITLDRRGPWSLYTTYTPGNVAPPTGRFSQTPEVARLVTDRSVTADDLTKPMYVATVDGRLRPATLRPLATVPDACSIQPAQSLILGLNRPLPLGFWNLQLRYRVAAPTVLRFALDPGTEVPIEATGSNRGFPVSGSGQLTFAIRYTAINALRLDTAIADSCISDVRIGVPVPIG